MNDDLYAPSKSSFEEYGQGPGDLTRVAGSFSMTRAYNEGGEALQRDLGVGIGATVIAGVLLACTYVLVGGFIGLIDVLTSELAVAALIIAGFLGGGLGYYLLIRLLQGGLHLMGMNMVRGKGQLEDLFRPFFRPGRFVGAVLLLYLVQTLLPFLVVVPGVMVFFFMMAEAVESDGSSALAEAIGAAQSGFLAFGLGLVGFFALRAYMDARLMLVAPLIFERGARVFEAIQLSWRRTAPHQFGLATLFGLNEILFLVSLLCCGAGALFSVPFHYATVGSATVQLLDGDSNDDSDAASDGTNDSGPSGKVDEIGTAGGQSPASLNNPGRFAPPDASSGNSSNPYA